MKKLIIGTALAASLTATTALADGEGEAIMEPTVIAADAVSSAGGILVPVIALVLIAVALTSNGSGGSHYYYY